MDNAILVLKILGRDIPVRKLFRLCLTASFIVHFSFVSVYLVEKYWQRGDENMLNSALDIEPQEVDMDIPPELLGGTSSPAPVEKQEWVEGKKKDGSDPEMEDINTNKISGDGTDKDGYLFSFNGDRAPSAIVDFDLRQYYPSDARAANVMEYTVTLLVQVDEKGNLITATVASGKAMYGFNEAALKVARRARFVPGYKSGKPVKMAHYLPIRFVLDN